MNYLKKSLEKIASEKYTDSVSLRQEGNWIRDSPCDINKDVTAFCPCPKNLPEGEFKSHGAISLETHTMY